MESFTLNGPMPDYEIRPDQVRVKLSGNRQLDGYVTGRFGHSAEHGVWFEITPGLPFVHKVWLDEIVDLEVEE